MTSRASLASCNAGRVSGLDATATALGFCSVVDMSCRHMASTCKGMHGLLVSSGDGYHGHDKWMAMEW